MGLSSQPAHVISCEPASPTFTPGLTKSHVQWRDKAYRCQLWSGTLFIPRAWPCVSWDPGVYLGNYTGQQARPQGELIAYRVQQVLSSTPQRLPLPHSSFTPAIVATWPPPPLHHVKADLVLVLGIATARKPPRA